MNLFMSQATLTGCKHNIKHIIVKLLVSIVKIIVKLYFINGFMIKNDNMWQVTYILTTLLIILSAAAQIAYVD